MLWALAVLLIGSVTSCGPAPQAREEGVESRITLVSVHYDDETTQADKELAEYLKREVRGQDHPTFEIELDERQYAAAITRLIDRSADSKYVARLTPYVFVVAEMLGAEFEVIGTYRSKAVVDSLAKDKGDDDAGGDGSGGDSEDAVAGVKSSEGFTYKSYIIVNKAAMESRLGRVDESLQALEQYLRSFDDGTSRPRFLYHNKFSTSSFFLPSVHFRDRGIIDLGIRTQDISKGREREVISSKELVKKVAAYRGAGDQEPEDPHLFAAVWDGTKAAFAEGKPLYEEFGTKVVFIPLEQDLPNDLLVVSASMSPTLRHWIRGAIEIMDEKDVELGGDFVYWQPIDVDATRRARSALAGLRQLARSQVSPVTVRIGVQGEAAAEGVAARGELRRLRQAAEDAVRLSGSEFVLWSEYYQHADFDWTLRPTHDGAVVLKSEIGGLERLKQEFQISFKDDKDLTERVGDLIRARMHRIRYVWPYSESDAPTILRDVDFSVPEDGSIQVQKIRWSNRQTNHFVIEKEFPAQLIEADARRFMLSAERFDEGLDAMGSISYRAVLPRPSEERRLFTILTGALILLFLGATVAAALELRRASSLPPPASSDVIDGAFDSGVETYHEPWRTGAKLEIAEADLLGHDRKAIEGLISELKLAEGPWWKRLTRRLLTDEDESAKHRHRGLPRELLLPWGEIGVAARLAALIDHLVKTGQLSRFTGTSVEFGAWNRAACDLFSRAVVGDDRPDEEEPDEVADTELLDREGDCLSRLVSMHFDGVLTEGQQAVSLFTKIWNTRQDPESPAIWIFSCEEELNVPLDPRYMAIADRPAEAPPIGRLRIDFKLEPPINWTLTGQDLQGWLLGRIYRHPMLIDNDAGEKCLRLHFKPLALLRGPKC